MCDQLSGFKKQRRQRRQSEFQRMRAAVSWFVLGIHAAEIADSGAAVFQSIAVQQLVPIAASGNTHAIAHAHDRREVTDDENGVSGRLTLAQQRNRAGEIVITIDPREARGMGVKQVQGRLAAVNPGQLSYPVLLTTV